MVSSLIAGSAMAASTPAAAPAAGAVSADAAKVAPAGMLSRLSVTYMPSFYGPSVTGPSMFQPEAATGAAEDRSAPLTILHDIAVGYKLNSKGLTLEPVVRFNQTLRASEEEGAVTRNANIQMLNDPWIKLKQSKIASFAGVNFGGSVRAYVPTSQLSQDVGLIVGSRASGTFSYDVPKTKLSLGLETFVQHALFNSSDREVRIKKNRPHYSVYANPNVTYQLTEKLALIGLYEIQSGHRAKSRGMEMDFMFSDIEAGVSWDVTKKINLSPVLNVKTGPGETMNLKTTSMNLYVTVKAL